MSKTKQNALGLGSSLVLLAALAVLGSCREAATPQTQGLDLQPVSLQGGGHPFGVVAKDFNGDGNVDLAVTSPKVARVSIYLGHGDGSFEPPAHFLTGKQPRGLIAEDFDEDGVPDLAVAATGRNSVFLHRGLGDGRFGGAASFPVNRRPFMLDPGDFNGDGHLDIAVANEGERAVDRGLSLLLGDGKGGFVPRSFSTGRYAADVAVADFDRDGKADVAVATWGTNDVNVHFGKGDGKFGPRRSFTYVGHGIYRVLAADLDKDGNPDMVWSDLRRNGLYVLYGDGRGGFPRTRLLKAGRGVRHAVAGDLNGDGWLDLVSANTGAGGISVILSDGEGDYLPQQNFKTGVFPRMVAIADMNGDQRPDLAVTNMRSDDVIVFLNQGPAPLQVATSKPRPASAKPATALERDTFRYPNGIALDPSGKYLLVADQQGHRVARVEIATGAITTLAGTGTPGSTGDGGPAIAASLRLPSGVIQDAQGNVYIADFGNNRVRMIDPSGKISTLAGAGKLENTEDGGPAWKAKLTRPFAVALDRAGNLIISEFGGKRIRKVDSSGTITTLAYEQGSGPGLGAVTGLAFDANGDLLLADQFNFRIRKLTTEGTLVTVAGSGKGAYGGDGGPALEADLSYPSGVATDSEGNIYVADQDGNRIRKITPDGIIRTLAGAAEKPGYSGDGGPASEARIWFPSHLVVDGKGNLYFTDRYNHCIRKVDASGIISTVAGSPDQEALTALRDRVQAQALREREMPAPQAPASPAQIELMWEYKFRSGSDANAAYAVAIDKKGGIYVAGDVGSGADWRILHLNSEGKKVWSFEFDSGHVDVPFALTLTPDGQVVAAGTVLGREATHSLVIAISRKGKENWRYEGRGKGRQLLYGIVADEDSNLYVAGQSDRKWQVKSLDPSGRLRWTYAGAGGAARAIDVDTRGHVFVAGTERKAWKVIELDAKGELVAREDSKGWLSRVPSAMAYGLRLDANRGPVITGSQTLRRTHARVEMLDASGRRLWEYLDPTTARATLRGVDIDPQANAVVVGESAADWLMLGLDPRGKLLWSSTHDGGGGPKNPDQAHAVAIHPAGGFVVAGVTHPVPPKHPSLGAVEWRIARYRVVEP